MMIEHLAHGLLPDQALTPIKYAIQIINTTVHIQSGQRFPLFFGYAKYSHLRNMHGVYFSFDLIATALIVTKCDALAIAKRFKYRSKLYSMAKYM